MLLLVAVSYLLTWTVSLDCAPVLRATLMERLLAPIGCATQVAVSDIPSIRASVRLFRTYRAVAARVGPARRSKFAGLSPPMVNCDDAELRTFPPAPHGQNSKSRRASRSLRVAPSQRTQVGPARK
ncbi:MAG: hypothetical protein JWN70_5399 [Planctomycetaceae bacterium]|nr:hypothetical protein [Planctomycetaceae bacterium]